jgi:hypothetical protein
MVLAGILIGVGIGAFASLDLAGGQATEVVKGALRTGRNAAVARRAPARVRIAEDGRTLVPLGLAVLGTWHFESEDLAGARGLVGTGDGFRIDEDGWIGRALRLGADARSHVSFPVHEDGAFDFSEGFALECALVRDAPVSAHVLSVAGALGLHVRSDGLLRAWFVPAVETGTGRRPGGEVVVEGRAGLLPLGEWRRVAATHDGRTFRLFVDDVLVGEVEEEARVSAVEGPLVIGGDSASFVGRIDSLVLSAWVAGEPHELSEGVAIAASAPREIAFDASGRPDGAVHAEPPSLELAFEDGRRALVRVSPWGTVE